MKRIPSLKVANLVCKEKAHSCFFLKTDVKVVDAISYCHRFDYPIDLF